MDNIIEEQVNNYLANDKTIKDAVVKIAKEISEITRNKKCTEYIADSFSFNDEKWEGKGNVQVTLTNPKRSYEYDEHFTFPLSYLWTENWKETFIKEREEEFTERMLKQMEEKEAAIKKAEEMKEQRDQSEYKRLRKKYEGENPNPPIIPPGRDEITH